MKTFVFIASSQATVLNFAQITLTAFTTVPQEDMKTLTGDMREIIQEDRGASRKTNSG